MKLRTVAALAIVAAILALAAPGLANATVERDVDLLTVSGSGEVRIAPEVAVVRVGVETRSERAADAIQENNRLMSRVVDAIGRLGIPERSIQTAVYSVSREYQHPAPDQKVPPRPVYVVANIASVRLTDVTRTGSVIDAATNAGANVVQGIAFITEKESEARQEALRQAVRDAQGRAQAIAEALGVRLVGVESVVESGGPVFIPQRVEIAAELPTRAAAPVLPGENVIRASVVVRYRIGR